MLIKINNNEAKEELSLAVYRWFLNHYHHLNEMKQSDVFDMIQDYVGSSVFRMAVLEISKELNMNISYTEFDWSEADEFEDSLILKMKNLF